MVDLRELRIVRLTNAIHGHIGIYSILGAKMGLYARDLLCYPISVLSFAGSKPPVSCLNDGLQIGSGATLGRGLIKLAETDAPCAMARFEANGKSLTLKLKDEYARRIQDDIRLGVERYGDSPAYWKYVRSLALKYWRQWDRKQIFDKS